MISEYMEYLRQLDKRLKREGIVQELNLDCDKHHIEDQVTVLEQFLYFNDVMQVCDSSRKITSLLGFENVGLTEYLRNQIYEKYEVEWNRKLAELTKQPDDAGVINREIHVISQREVKMFTEALNLTQEEVVAPEETTSWSGGFWGSSVGFEFDDEEEDFDDDMDFSDYDEEPDEVNS